MKARLSLSSVRVRLALWNVGVLAFVLAGLAVLFSVTLRANISAAVDRHLSQRAHHGQHILEDPRPSPRLRQPPPGEEPDSSGEMRPRVFLPGGRGLIPTDTPLDAAALRRAEAGAESYKTIQSAAGDVRVYTLPVVQNGTVIGVVQTGTLLTHIYAERARMTATFLYLVPVVLLVAGLGAAFLTDRALRPVRRIAVSASRIEAEDLSHRLPVTGDDEFSDLAETINGMLSRLEASFARQEQAFEQQKRFAADASHELRTPLTIIKANTSLSLSERRTASEYEKTLRAVDAAADRMTRIVQDLLLLARADADQLAYALTPTSLADVLHSAAAAVPKSDAAPIEIDLPEPLWALGHADSLTRLFSNLLENAARHTPPDGYITVTAEALGERIVVQIADTGAGIAPEHLPHVTERFYRVEAARSRAQGGTGLGLAICRSIADAHGGHLEVSSILGQGTTVRVTLQAAPKQAALSRNFHMAGVE